MNVIQGLVSNIMLDAAPILDTWRSHNCPACVYRGHARGDTKGRGNHRFNTDGGISYNCYNCGLKINWVPGRYISKNFEVLLSAFGAPEATVWQLKNLARELVKSGEFADAAATSKLYQAVEVRDLPEKAKSIHDIILGDRVPKQFMKVMNAMYERNRYLIDLDLYWSPESEYQLYNRFIIPYYMNGKVIGYTARHYEKDTFMRYVNQVSTNIFYNFDLLNDANLKTIFVAEGPLDAALMGGVSINNHTLGSQQIDQLKAAQARGKKIVIVPDRDSDGMRSIKQALENGFSVALPQYGTVRENNRIRFIKDFEEATAKMGRLFSLQLLHSSVYDTEFDIKLHANAWC